MTTIVAGTQVGERLGEYISETPGNFLSTPDTYQVSSGDMETILNLGRCMGKVIAGIGKVMIVGEDHRVSNRRVWQRVTKHLKAGIPRWNSDLALKQAFRTPNLFEMSLSMVEGEPKFLVDYVSIPTRTSLNLACIAHTHRKLVSPDFQEFGGVITPLVEKVLEWLARGMYVIEPYRNRAGMNALADCLNTAGVRLLALNENAVHFATTDELNRLLENHALLLDFIQINDQVNHSLLIRRILSGDLILIQPYRPFISTQAFLAIIQNIEKDPEVETVLLAFIDKNSLQTVREHLNPSYLVHNKADHSKLLDLACNERYCIRSSQPPYQRYTFESDYHFQRRLREVMGVNGLYVIERENRPALYGFNHLARGGEGVTRTYGWEGKLKVYFSYWEIAEMYLLAEKWRSNDSYYGRMIVSAQGAALTTEAAVTRRAGFMYE